MKLPYFFNFLTNFFGVSGIPRITTASEASHELMKSYLPPLITLLTPDDLLVRVTSPLRRNLHARLVSGREQIVNGPMTDR
jgi:hypothetical protein